MPIVGAIVVPHPPLIVPAVGRGEERRIQRTIDAYRRAAGELLALEPEVLVLTSPHAPLFRDAFHVTTDPALSGSMAQFRARRERLDARCDTVLAQAVLEQAADAGIAAVDSERYRDQMDHATYVPLFFIREAFRRTNPTAAGDLPCPIVRIGLSGFPPETHRAFGRAIARAIEGCGRRAGFIASGDLSHRLLPEGPYGFAPEGPVFDERIGEIFASGDLDGLFTMDGGLVEAAAECGLRSFQIMAGAIEDLGFESRMLSNEGPFGVGYGVATLLPPGREGAQDGNSGGSAHAGGVADWHVALARLAVETFVRTGAPAGLPPDTPADLLKRRAGVFVSLHGHGELRGCIGTTSATCGSVAHEILQNGVSVCSRDPRFSPVRPDELDFLEYSVDELGDAEPISSSAELDPARYGVIVTKGRRRGLLLPNLEGVDTVEEQLSIAKRKAGIRPDDARVRLERFEVVRHTAGGEPRR